MRFFLLLILTFFISAPMALADCIPDPGDPGVYYDENGNFCSPTGATGGTQNTGTQSGSQLQQTGTKTGPSVALYNPLKSGTSLMSFLENILKVVIRIGAIVIVLMLVYVGFKFVTARGEPGAIKTAKDNLLWTVVGALVLLGATAIAKGIEATVQALGAG
jgi:hypothetical protein